MTAWRKCLRFDPIPPLLASGDEALRYFTRRDLLGEDAGPVSRLWDLPEARRLLAKQRPDGSFAYTAAKSKSSAVKHRLVETWKQFRYLVEVWGFTRENAQAERAAEFLFSCQTAEGDIRGFLANQYATYYTGAILSLLIQAGYGEDPRIKKGFEWLLAMRQDDGGWTVPILTHPFSGKEMYRLTSRMMDPVEPDRSKPFSHNWTGMVLRAFAAHDRRRTSAAAKAAANLLADRFFQPDVYSSYKAASYWVRFQYPFWWNHLVAALDSITRIGLDAQDPRIARAVDWLAEHQQNDGLWRETYVKSIRRTAAPKSRNAEGWISLAICRDLKRALGDSWESLEKSER
jgi:hypothetical protein